MIDFIRIQYRDKSIIEPFIMDELNFPELRASCEYHSGEFMYPYIVRIENIEIRATNKYVYLRNSLHKLYNIIDGDTEHNYNDFNYAALCFTIDFLCSKLIDLEHQNITQLEFGLNVSTPIPAEEIIENNLLMQQYKLPNRNEGFQGRGAYKQFNHANYFIKIYDKAKQYRRPENILRYELKFINRKDFNKLGIHKITDLKSKEHLQKLFSISMKRFEELLIVDAFDDSDLPVEIVHKLAYYLNPFSWTELSERKNRNKKSKIKKDLETILTDYDLLKTKSYLKEALILKFNQLIN